MTRINRRSFNRGMLLGAAAVGTLAMPYIAHGQGAGKVVVIGGGAGGATVARYLKKDSPELDVTLIEMNKQYTTCFFSNWYVGGFRSFESITHSYDTLAGMGINVINGKAAGVDAGAKTVTMDDGTVVPYDKLVMSPGIDFQEIEGYGAAEMEMMPHAYKAGHQTKLLKASVEGMVAGGTFVMVAPNNPYRCPPGPYERISVVANYFKDNNPNAKIIIVDPKAKFSKQALFQDAWETYYPGMIEWVGADFTGGGIARVGNMEVEDAAGEVYTADAMNVIPSQKAGMIAAAAGATNDTGWCPINPADFSSTLLPDTYVLGDSSIAASMPKSGFSANSQAKVVANAIRAELTGSRTFPARFRNTCWSLVAPNDAVKVGASYEAGAEKVETTDKFISAVGEDAATREQTYQEAIGWYDGITADMFG